MLARYLLARVLSGAVAVSRHPSHDLRASHPEIDRHRPLIHYQQRAARSQEIATHTDRISYDGTGAG